ncbi:MAG: N-6 DNA methylase, partial [Akkermansiaceae bacterium]
ELVHDGRWNGYDTPPTGNANYAWILHMVSKLSKNGIAGFDSVHLRYAPVVLANGSMSTNTKGEGEIRQKLVENDLVDTAPRESASLQSEAIPQVVSEAKDNMIALPGQLFYTTQIPVCLWFLTKNKKADSQRDYRNREGETLFIDTRKIGSMISRTQKGLYEDDIHTIAA